MAGDWIKMRTGLRRHPKVIAMSRYLCERREFMIYCGDPVRMTCRDSVTEIVTFSVVTRVTVASLLEVWGAVNDAVGADGRIPYMELSDLDDIADIPAFGDAMNSVGWVIEADDELGKGLIFPNFLEFNTPEKERRRAKTDAERAREYRKRQKEKAAQPERHERHETSRGEEKRRSNTPQPPKGGEYTDEFECFWKAYPNGKGKAAASKAWGRLSPEHRSLALENVRHRAAHDPDWTRDGGQFVPMASTYLNGRRWEDEIDRAPQRPRIVV